MTERTGPLGPIYIGDGSSRETSNIPTPQELLGAFIEANFPEYTKPGSQDYQLQQEWYQAQRNKHGDETIINLIPQHLLENRRVGGTLKRIVLKRKIPRIANLITTELDQQKEIATTVNKPTREHRLLEYLQKAALGL